MVRFDSTKDTEIDVGQENLPKRSIIGPWINVRPGFKWVTYIHTMLKNVRKIKYVEKKSN